MALDFLLLFNQHLCHSGYLKIINIISNKRYKDEAHKYILEINRALNKKAQKLLDELGNPVDIILKDPNGTKSIFLGAYGVPETYIIDRELIILRKYIGPINSENEIEIKKLVK